MYVELVDETGQVPSEIIEQTKEVLAFAAKKLNLKESTEMSVTFVDNARSHELNLQYRETDRPTDVISLEYKPDESEFFFDEDMELPEDNHINYYTSTLFYNLHITSKFKFWIK